MYVVLFLGTVNVYTTDIIIMLFIYFIPFHLFFFLSFKLGGLTRKKRGRVRVINSHMLGYYYYIIRV